MENKFQIDSIHALKDWLLSYQISFTNWGNGLTKTLDMLYEEIRNGECDLVAPPPMRSLSVVQVLIIQGGKLLLEKEQVLCDNRVRKREVPPSEKMLAWEDCHQAAIRCVVEELQIREDEISVLTKNCSSFVKQRESSSYPGLQSQYILYPVEVRVPALPQQEFWTDEKTGDGGDHVIGQHKWGWEPWKSLEELMAKSFPDETD